MRILCGILVTALMFQTLAGINVHASADDVPESTAITDFIESRISDEQVPGMAIAIVRNGQIDYLNGFGCTNVKTLNKYVTGETVFDLASCSKSFTSLGIMLLVESGRLDIDAPVNRYLSELIFADRAEGALITVRQLLNHTSGLPGVFSEPLAFQRGDDAMTKLIAAMAKVHLNRPPGSYFEYSNMNYSLLGAIIEHVSGKPFEAFMQDSVFIPLGLNSTTLYPEKAAQMERADGHQIVFGTIVPRNIEIYRSASPAGWVMSDAADMGRWVELHLNKGVLDGRQIIPTDIIETVHMPTTTFIQNDETVGYGMGWMSATTANGIEVIWHGGDTPNFAAEMIILPQYDAGIVMLVNGQTVPDVHTIAVDILNFAVGSELLLPDAPWWASWEAIDRIATGALGISFLFFIGLIFYIRRKLRNRHNTEALRTYHIWKIVLPSAPLALLGTIILAVFLVVEFLLGYNIFRVLNRFGEYAPSGVSISAATLFIIICLWAITLSGVTVFRAKKNREN